MHSESFKTTCKDGVMQHCPPRRSLHSQKLDRLLTHPFVGIPVFLCVMLPIFYLTFGSVGSKLQFIIQFGTDAMINSLSNFMIELNVSDWLHALLIDGIFAGIGSLLLFLPPILVFSFLLSLLEEVGYLSRVSCMMDRFWGKPSALARSSSKRRRCASSTSSPRSSALENLPLYGMMAAAFFPKYAPLLLVFVCFLSIIAAFLTERLLRFTLAEGEYVPATELLDYRIPSLRKVLEQMLRRAKRFLQKIFTFVLAASILIWFLKSFDWQFHPVADPSSSILASITSVIAPIFAPIGFHDWRACAALISNLTSKESVVSTLSILTGAGSREHLSTALHSIFTPLSAFSFLVFAALSTAHIPVSSKQGTSRRAAVLAALYRTGTAYLMALAIYQLGALFIR